MIPKIMKSAGVMKNVLDYNERKVALGVADRVAAVGFLTENPDELTIRNVFQMIENANIRTKNVSFHLTLNPDATDVPLDDESLKQLVDEALDSLGYAGQPYVVYRHRDIDREHFHIVSTNIRPDGRRVNGSNQQYKTLAAFRQLGKKYGFAVGRTQKAKRLREEGVKSFAPVFYARSKDTNASLKEALRDTLKYNFTSTEQFQTVLEQHGVKAYFLPSSDGRGQLGFRGLDQNGDAVTPIMLEAELDHTGLRALLDDAIARNTKDAPEVRRESLQYRKEVASLLTFALEKSKSESHFLALCSRQGLGVTLHRTSGDEGEVYGITVTDHIDKSVWKASDLNREFTAKVKNMDHTVWTHDPAPQPDNGPLPGELSLRTGNRQHDGQSTGNKILKGAAKAAAFTASAILKMVIAGTFSTGRRGSRRRSYGKNK